MADSTRSSNGDEQFENKIRKAELEQVAKRRRVAFGIPTSEQCDGPMVESTLTGVALSGGGIRSAMFNLGFVQALEQKDLLRHVDYMSSVSGGGYTGGYLAALATREAERRNSDDTKPRTKIDLGVDEQQKWNAATETQNGRVTRRYTLYDAGRYVSDYLGAGWRLFCGLIIPISWLLAVALIGCTCAFLWRMLDFRVFRMYWDALGFNGILGEFWISFVPFFVLVLIGAVRGVLAALRRPNADVGVAQAVTSVSGWNKTLLLGIAATFLVSLAVGLGNGYTRVWTFESTMERSDYVFAAAIVVVLLQLPILFGGRSLVQSAQHESPAWKQAFSLTVCYIAFIAIWFYAFYMFGIENISGYATHRSPDLIVTDIKDPVAFENLFNEPAYEGVRLGAKDELARLEKANRNLDAASEKYFGEDNWEKHQGRFLSRFNGTRWSAWFTSMWTDWDKPPAVLIARERVITDFNAFLRRPPEENRSEYTKGVRNPLNRLLLCEIERDRALEGLLQKTLSDDSLAKPADPKGDRKQDSSSSPLYELKSRGLTITLLTQLTERAQSESEGFAKTIRDERKLLWDLNKDDLASSPKIESKDKERIRLTIASQFALVDEYVEELASERRESEAFLEYWDKLTLYGDDAQAERRLGASSNKPTSEIWNNLNDWDDQDVASFNRLLLQMMYPEIIRDRTLNSTMVVAGVDQVYRLLTIVILTPIVLALFMYGVDLNRSSPWMKVYREGIFKQFLDQPFRAGAPDAPARHIRLSQLRSCDAGMPYPLFVAAALIRGNEGQGSHIRSFPFVLTPDFVGCREFGYAPTSNRTGLEDAYLNGKVTLLDAVSLSGAAFAPLMAQDIVVQMLMSFTNLRLGNWLPNPKRKRIHGDPTTSRDESGMPIVRPRTLIGDTWSRVVCEKHAPECWNDWDFGFVADGGFRDFLGVEELLRRRCRLIIAVDAGCNNGKYELGALADLIRIARREYGIQLLDLDHETPIDIERIRRDREDRIPQPYIGCRIRYPSDETATEEGTGGDKEEQQSEDGFFFYCQMSLTGNEEIDLQQFRHIHPNFPDEPITNQFYTQDQVESYRQLGYHVGQLLCSEMPSGGTSTPTFVAEQKKRKEEAETTFEGTALNEAELHDTQQDSGKSQHDDAGQNGEPVEGDNAATDSLPVVDAKLETSNKSTEDEYEIEKTSVEIFFESRFKAVTRRLLSGYSEEALRETSVDGDIEPISRAVRHHDCWDLFTDSNIGAPWEEFNELIESDDHRTVRKALRRYDTDASFRRACRRLMSHLWCGSRAINKRLDEWQGQRILQIARGDKASAPRASAVALMFYTCSDLIYGVRHPLARGNFQVGGRERLAWLCEDYAQNRGHSKESKSLQDENSLPDNVARTRRATVLSRFWPGGRCNIELHAASEDELALFAEEAGSRNRWTAAGFPPLEVDIPTSWYDDGEEYDDDLCPRTLAFRCMRDGWNLISLATEMSRTVLVSEPIAVSAAFLECTSLLLPGGRNLLPQERDKLRKALIRVDNFTMMEVLGFIEPKSDEEQPKSKSSTARRTSRPKKG